MKTCIVYYSVSGQTEFVAQKMKALLQSDLIEIQTEAEIKPNLISRYYGGGKMMLSKQLPELKEHSFHFEEYDTVIIGFPNWGSNCPPAVEAFLAEQNLKDKNIYLFTTYVARGGESCLRNVAKKLPHHQVSPIGKFSLPKSKPEKAFQNTVQDALRKAGLL